MILLSSAGNPASNGTPQVICVGDSLTQGYQPTGNTAYTVFWKPQTWGGLGVTVTNLGIGGQTVGPRLSAWGPEPSGFLDSLEASIIPRLDFYSGMNLVNLAFGTNDLGYGRPAIMVYSYLRQACQRIRSLGARVVVAQLISRNGYDSAIQATNTFLRANWQQFADGFADIREHSPYAADLDTPGAYSNTTIYQNDGIHLRDSGYEMFGNVILAEDRRVMLDGGV